MRDGGGGGGTKNVDGAIVKLIIFDGGKLGQS